MRSIFYKKRVLNIIFSIILPFFIYSVSTNSFAEDKKVKTKQIKSEVYTPKIKLFGSTEPIKHSKLVLQSSGVIDHIYANQGETILEGDPLLSIKNNALNEHIQAKKAELNKVELIHKANINLRLNHSISEAEFSQSKADLVLAQYELAKINRELEDTIVFANFTGVIEEFDYEVGDYIKQDTVVATISDFSKLKVMVDVPEKYREQVNINSQATINYALNNIKAKVNYISRIGSQSTHTFKAKIISEESLKDFIFGTSSNIFINLPSENAYRIHSSYISSDLNGDLFIHVIENEKVSKFFINILDGFTDGSVIIKGTVKSPEFITLITVGHLNYEIGTSVTQIKE